MMTTLQDQVILITGASRGIGSAIAEACAQSGAHVIINYKSNTQAAQKLCHDVKHMAVLLKRYKQISINVNK